MATLKNDVLFLDGIELCSTQKEMGISEPITRKTDGVELTPQVLFEMVRDLDPTNEADQARLAVVGDGLAYLKQATIIAAIKLCPAYNLAEVPAVPAENQDAVLGHLKMVLENNPLTHSPAIDALIELTPIFGDADLAVYEPAAPQDVVDAVVASTDAEPAVVAEPATEPVAEPQAAQDEPAPAPPADEPATATAPDQTSVIVAGTAAPALTEREMAMVHARSKSAKKIAGMMETLAGALKDELEGIENATAALPTQVEA